jgi:Tfp pilus assembly protein PilV
MLMAAVILLVGLVGVAQLVPVSIFLNQQNRLNSAAPVFAQRELEQMLDQPRSSSSFTDVPFGNTCQLGDPTITNSVQGAAVGADLKRPTNYPLRPTKSSTRSDQRLSLHLSRPLRPE